VTAQFGAEHAEAALDLLHLTDMAWHDCYAPQLEVEPRVLDDILVCAGGDLAALIRVARMAVLDFRDVRVEADAIRRERR
jgi:hypothetical protein